MAIQWTVSILLVLSIAVQSEILGPPKGAKGTIDWRYPNDIVQPLPDCPEEGVFPHPRSCVWYYRCHDRLGLGFYFRTYYECEPGTVFSNELDQCIFPHLAPAPCNTYNGGSTLAGTATNATQKPQLPTDPPIDSTVSPGLSPPVPSQTLPPITETNGTTEDIITVTFPGPLSNSTQAPITTTTGETTPTLPNGSSIEIFPSIGDSNDHPNLRCFIYYYGCSTIDICPYNTENSFQWELCQARQICYSNNKVVINRLHCSENTYFTPALRRCYVYPQAYDICSNEPEAPSPPTSTTSTPPNTEIPGTEIINVENVKCSETDLKPETDWIKGKFCKKIPLCDKTGVFQGIVELCSGYYLCDRKDNEWDIIQMECAEPMMYSYKEDRCIDQPNKEDLCPVFLRQFGIFGVPTPNFKF